MTRPVFESARLQKLYMLNRWQFKSAGNMDMVSDAIQGIVKALAEAPHWQITETYWNSAMQQNIIWSIAFDECTKEIFKE